MDESSLVTGSTAGQGSNPARVAHPLPVRWAHRGFRPTIEVLPNVVDSPTANTMGAPRLSPVGW
jgi:hypothetical protein